MIDVAVLDDCTKTVANTPIIKPVSGFLNISFLKSSLALCPATSLNPLVISSREIIKKYKQNNKIRIRSVRTATYFTLSDPLFSKIDLS